MILPGTQHKKKAQDKEMAQNRAEKDICIGDTKVQNEQKIDQELKK